MLDGELQCRIPNGIDGNGDSTRNVVIIGDKIYADFFDPQWDTNKHLEVPERKHLLYVCQLHQGKMDVCFRQMKELINPLGNLAFETLHRWEDTFYLKEKGYYSQYIKTKYIQSEDTLSMSLQKADYCRFFAEEYSRLSTNYRRMHSIIEEYDSLQYVYTILNDFTGTPVDSTIMAFLSRRLYYYEQFFGQKDSYFSENMNYSLFSLEKKYEYGSRIVTSDILISDLCQFYPYYLSEDSHEQLKTLDSLRLQSPTERRAIFDALVDYYDIDKCIYDSLATEYSMKAMEYYRQAESLYKTSSIDNGSTFYYLAEIKRLLEEYGEAARYYEYAYQALPDLVDCKYYSALCEHYSNEQFAAFAKYSQYLHFLDTTNNLSNYKSALFYRAQIAKYYFQDESQYIADLESVGKIDSLYTYYDTLSAFLLGSYYYDLAAATKNQIQREKDKEKGKRMQDSLKVYCRTAIDCYNRMDYKQYSDCLKSYYRLYQWYYEKQLDSNLASDIFSAFIKHPEYIQIDDSDIVTWVLQGALYYADFLDSVYLDKEEKLGIDSANVFLNEVGLNQTHVQDRIIPSEVILPLALTFYQKIPPHLQKEKMAEYYYYCILLKSNYPWSDIVKYAMPSIISDTSSDPTIQSCRLQMCNDAIVHEDFDMAKKCAMDNFLIQESIKDTFISLMIELEYYSKDKDYNAVVRYANEYLERNSSPNVMLIRGISNKYLGNYEEARTDFQGVIYYEDSTNIIEYSPYALCYLGKPKEARRLLKKTLANDSVGEHYWMAAEVYCLLGQYTKAKYYAKKMIQKKHEELYACYYSNAPLMAPIKPYIDKILEEYVHTKDWELVLDTTIAVIPYVDDQFEHLITCTINNRVKGNVQMVFDSGAEFVQLSKEDGYRLMRDSVITQEPEPLGKVALRSANGEHYEQSLFKIDTLTIGDITFTDVWATMAEKENTPSLLGQTVLYQLIYEVNPYSREIKLSQIKPKDNN